MRLPTWLQRFLPRKRTAGHPYSIKGWVRGHDGCYWHPESSHRIEQIGGKWRRSEVIWVGDNQPFWEYPTLRAAIEERATRVSGANSVAQLETVEHEPQGSGGGLAVPLES